MKREEFARYFNGVVSSILDLLPDEAREIDYIHLVCMKLRHIEGDKIDSK